MYGRSFRCDGKTIWSAQEPVLDCAAVRAFFDGWTEDACTGRRPLMAGTVAGIPCLARQFTHGGMLRNLLKDRYMARSPRSVTELVLLASLRERGLPVPRPVFAWVEAMPLGYRQGLVTQRIPDAADLAELDPAVLSPPVLRKLVALLERFFDAGLVHPDLNIKNVLVRERGSHGPELYLLDFDRARLLPHPVPESGRTRMVRRLFRSFDKMGRLSVWDSVDPADLPNHVAQAWRGYRKIRRFRALFWMLNRK